MRIKIATVIVAFIAITAFSALAADSEDKPSQMWLHSRDGCRHGFHHQPDGPMAIILFCEDALGDYLGILYYSHMEAPSPADFVRKLTEKEKESFYKIWSLGNRLWQDPIWASDVTSYAWSPDNTKLYIGTSEVYGSGALFELDLVRRKYRQLEPTDKEAKLNNPGHGYVITRIDNEASILYYTRAPWDSMPDEARKEKHIKIK